MAIVQISQITNRKGLQVDLPQLAGAELGWSTDTRQLYIGNGTLEDGAPIIGNTEILTEFSDILNFSNAYTYKGQAAGYTVQTTPSGTPVSQSLQSWLDQYASVLDFGAVGDGTTDCTEAINWALYQLYCRESNPQVRRSLFFPAGVYKVSGPINVPSYATLVGEGADNSVIYRTAGSVFTGTIQATATMAGATIAGTTLTIAGAITGTISVGMLLSGGTVLPNTYITAGSGTSWTVGVSQTMASATLTGIGAGNTLTIDTISSGTIAVGQILHGTGIATGTVITAEISPDTWTVNINQLVSSTTTIIGGVQEPVIQTADSLQQTGTNIALGGAVPPSFITIQNMGFQTVDPSNDVLLVQAANNCKFQNVTFVGASDTTGEIDGTSCIVFAAPNGITTAQIVFDACFLTGTTYGMYNNVDANLATRSITIQNSIFQFLYQGVNLSAGITGARIVANAFDNIFAEGIIFKTVSLNASGQNIFYDVGNHYNGLLSPASSIIEFRQDNNISISDMFQRADAYSTTYSRININNTTSITTTNGTQLALGTYKRNSGLGRSLSGSVLTPSTLFSIDTNFVQAFSFEYTIERNNAFRTGKVMVATDGNSANLNWTDDFVENDQTDIALVVTQAGNIVNVAYTSSPGVIGSIYYSITYLV